MKRMAEMLSSFFFYCTFNITALFHTFAESKNIYSMETPQLNAHNKEEHRPSHSEEQNHEFKIIKGKTYRYDDEFKKKARAHQFAFREIK